MVKNSWKMHIIPILQTVSSKSYGETFQTLAVQRKKLVAYIYIYELLKSSQKVMKSMSLTSRPLESCRTNLTGLGKHLPS